MLLELKAVSKSFGSLVVADAIDLQVGRGDALGIIGPNGAGKTTLFNLITGGLKPTRAASGSTAGMLRLFRPSSAASLAWAAARCRSPSKG